MEKIRLTPENLKIQRKASNKPFVKVSMDGIFFNRKAVKLLYLSAGSKFSLEIEDGKLYYIDEVNNGFEIKYVNKRSSYGVRSVKFMQVLQQYGIVKEVQKVIFEIGIIKNGRRELIPVTENK